LDDLSTLEAEQMKVIARRYGNVEDDILEVTF
jgi:hypothetical protein